MPLEVVVVEPLGADTMLCMRSEKTKELVARTDPSFAFAVNDIVNFHPNMGKAHYFDKKTELSILPLP
jgi:multiple sugar transport system ATP-binding protein